LRGDPDHPVTSGRLCPKARFQLERHRSAARLRVPLIRSGSELAPASWTSALDLVAERMLEARKAYGSLSILHYWDAGSMGVLKGLYSRLTDLFGGVTEPEGSLCWSAGLAAQRADFGRVVSHDPQDLIQSGAVIIWGRNPADTNPHLMPFLRAAAARGAPIVVIDPLKTATVRELDARHLAPRPGSDAILALSLGAELIRRGGFDHAFCRERANGFEAFVGAVAEVNLSSAADACGCAKGELLALADLLAFRGSEAPPPAFVLGYGLQRHARGGEAVRAIDALAALAGSIGRPGGGANYANLHTEGLLGDLRRPDAVRARRFFHRASFGRQVADLLDAGRKGTETPISVFLGHGANPVAQLPATGRVIETFGRIPFKVVAEIQPTDTTAMADVVLPVADFLEDEDLYFCAWHSYLTWAVPAVPPISEVWPETRIIAELGRRLGLGEDLCRSPGEWIGLVLAPLVRRYPDLAPGGEIGRLRGRALANPAAVSVPWKEGAFATSSGLFEFGRTWPSLAGLTTSSTRELRPIDREEDRRFHLLTPQHRFALHSQFHEQVRRRTSRQSGLPAVFVSPSAAERLGFADGQAVRIVTAQGSLTAHLVLDTELREDTIYVYSGGSAGIVSTGPPTSANFLTPDHLTDMGAQAAFYDCRCTLEPVE
jgi:anaerobic selenocysteine-containing dehydrogenase